MNKTKLDFFWVSLYAYIVSLTPFLSYLVNDILFEHIDAELKEKGDEDSEDEEQEDDTVGWLWGMREDVGIQNEELRERLV